MRNLNCGKPFAGVKYPSAAAGAVLVFMFAMFALMGFYPFGDKCVSWCDMNQQVVPLLTVFKDILSGRDGIFLNMANAGGMNFWGVFFFFLSSPFSFLAAFVEKADMMSFMNILTVLKMAAAAAAACIFFRRRFPQIGSAMHIALGFTYGLCGYAMHYYQNIVWLDMMYLFPLLMVALERLYNDNKTLMYTVVTALMVIVNYYISYMIVVFLILSSGAYLLFAPEKHRRGEVMLRFIVSSVLAAMLSAPVWLPSLIQYFDTARTEGIFDSLSKGSLLPHYKTTWPLLYCTPIIFASLPFLYRKGKGKRGGRRFFLLIFMLTVVPQFIDPINKMWHMGSYMSFPYRYGFITVLCGLALAACAIGNICGDDAEQAPGNRRPLGSFGGLLVAAAGLFGTAVFGYLMTSRWGREVSAYTRTLWGTTQSFKLLTVFFVISGVSFAVVFIMKKYKILSGRAFKTFICLITAAVSAANVWVYMGSVNQDASDFRAAAQIAGKIPDDGFYRVKAKRKIFDVNVMGAMGYGNLAHYTSLTSEDYLFAMKKLGYSSYWMEVNSDGGTFFSDALLSNKYTVTDDSKMYSGALIHSTDRFDIFQNEITLPDALFSAARPEMLRKLPDGGRLERQNELFKSLLNSRQDIFMRHDPEEDETGDSLLYKIFAEDRKALYFDCFDKLTNGLIEPINDAYRVLVNGEAAAERYPAQTRNGILYLGTFTDTDVEIVIEIKKTVSSESFGVYSLDMNELSEAAGSAAGARLKVNGNTASLEYDAKTGGYLYLTLPYLDGYTLTVNGNRQEPYRVLDAFTAIAVEEGENEIELRFTPPGLNAGFVSFAAGAVLAVTYTFARKRRRAACTGKLRKAAETTAYAAAVTAAAAVIGVIYIFPIVVFVSGSSSLLS